MNGLIQHLAISGLDLSEDNIVGIQVFYSYNDVTAYQTLAPQQCKLVLMSGGFQSIYQLNLWGIGIFDIDVTSKTSKRLSFEEYHNGTSYIADIKIDGNGFLRVINGSGNYEYACAIWLKS